MELPGTSRAAGAHGAGGPYLISVMHRSFFFLIEREKEGSIHQKLCLGIPQVAPQWHKHVSYPSTSPTPFFSSKAQLTALFLFLLHTWVSQHSTSQSQKNSVFKTFQVPLLKAPMSTSKYVLELSEFRFFPVVVHKTCYMSRAEGRNFNGLKFNQICGREFN